MKISCLDNIKQNRICGNCVGEPKLEWFVNTEGVNGLCAYCKNAGRAISLKEFALQVEEIYDKNYFNTLKSKELSSNILYSGEVIGYFDKLKGHPTTEEISHIANVSHHIAEHIQMLLSGQSIKSYNGGKNYPAIHDPSESQPDALEMREWQAEWNAFERSIKKEARFFSKRAMSQLGDLFNGLNQLITEEGERIIKRAGPDTQFQEIHRARVFQNEDELLKAISYPDNLLGAPPSKLAKSGRMNAYGISVFYGATTSDTAIAEVRPPVGAKVVVARFNIIRPIRLLDLTKINGARFVEDEIDRDDSERSSQVFFLNKLSQQLSRPIIPVDQEMEYLLTQVIADYLASDETLDIDGILFYSAQKKRDELNFVLFNKAARCDKLIYSEGVKVFAQPSITGKDNPQKCYTVFEMELPKKSDKLTSAPTSFFEHFKNWNRDESHFDNREVTLSIDIRSVTVHDIDGIGCSTIPMMVKRERRVMEE